MKPIETAEFDQFFQEVNGYTPFPWQSNLAKHVCEKGSYPEVLSLPTGTGKTSCVEISVFHLAYDLSREAERKAPLRLLWVVDRRLIVDDVHDRAKALASKLENALTTPQETVTYRVATALKKASGEEEPPLAVARLRGGIEREDDWARTPTQPTVLSSTVDQVGSRLLMRGYGISEGMRPLHAGLMGCDALIILDEVHLSEPFRQTLEQIKKHYTKADSRWNYVSLSATPRTGARTVFSLDEKDRTNDLLKRRLSNRKTAKIVDLGKVEPNSDKHARAFALEALHLHENAKNVLVVVNRIELARKVQEQIAENLVEKEPDTEVVRLVGRARSTESDIVRDTIVSRCKSRQNGKKEESAPIIVVATQTIEAGADLDFDGLVTQIAPIDALQQRFGRLNRMGHHESVRASILATTAETSVTSEPDPVYDDASKTTWTWLYTTANELQEVDFATSSINIAQHNLTAMQSPSRSAPLLMPGHVEFLSRTSPAPPASPDVSLYLHGSPNCPADVNVIWRADMPKPTKSHTPLASEILSIVPPRIGETMALPASTLRRWLGKQELSETSDLENDVTPKEDRNESYETTYVWLWNDFEQRAKPILSKRIRPGNTIVLSTEVGGCDCFGWNPEAQETIDIGQVAAEPYAHRQYAVRIHPTLIETEMRIERGGIAENTAARAEIAAKSADLWSRLSKVIRSESTIAEIAAEIKKPDFCDMPTSLREKILKMVGAKNVSVHFPYDLNSEGQKSGAIIVAPCGVKSASKKTKNSEAATESDISSIYGNGTELRLDHHLSDVGEKATEFATRLGLDKHVAEDLELAGRLHDTGKRDSRFQAYLSGTRLTKRNILAKSGVRRSKREDEYARKISKLPDGWRHEVLSVALATGDAEFAKAHDPELVMWLIGTHHGRGRASFDHVDAEDGVSDPRIQAARLNGPHMIGFTLEIEENGRKIAVEWSQMFGRLKERYGTWGLASLEAILRLADHRASEQPKTRV